jgi:hypothetical protein
METSKVITEKSSKKKRGPNGGARPGAGRPAFQPTNNEREQVEELAGIGLPMDQIAMLIRGGIDDETLRKHFHVEMVSGKAKANSQVGRTLFQKALDGDTTAAIWWTKTQMRWKEVKEVDVKSSDGSMSPLQITDDQLVRIISSNL